MGTGGEPPSTDGSSKTLSPPSAMSAPASTSFLGAPTYPVGPGRPIAYAYGPPLAGLFDRFLAALLDLVLLGVLGFVLLVPFGLIAYSASLSWTAPGWWMAALFGPLFLVMVVLWVLYFTYFEGTSGQTLGKRVMSLQVVEVRTGRPPQMRRALLRTLLRIIDWMPMLYFVGFVIALATDRKQRLGDLVAETMVVRL